jgi:shikimate dehydrogenase
MKSPVSFPVLCGSIAGSIGGMGVRMHNAAFKHLNLPYTYVSFEPMSAKGAVNAMRELGIRGLGVTMPFKEEVIPLLDELDPLSAEIHAVNTIVNEDGRLKGYNTDAHGFLAAITAHTDLNNKKVAVIGAGGAAKTIIWALKQHGSHIRLYNKSIERGRMVAEQFGIEFKGNHELLTASSDYDILVNATSVGFKSEETLFLRDRLVPGSVVFDVVFIPTETTLIREARAIGCIGISGTEMLMHQACRQFELYTKVPAPMEIYESVMQSILSGK